MIQVKENLLPINGLHIENNGSIYNSKAIRFNELPVEEGEKYTLSFYGKQNEKGSGRFSLAFHREKTGDQIFEEQYACDQRNSLTFVYTSEMDRFNFYTDIIGNCAGVSADFIMLKLEKEELTPYLPHKSNVKAENQAIFVAGGVFQEVYPL